MKKSLRAFGIGLFLAGAAWSIYVEFFAPPASEEVKQLQQQLEASEQQIKDLQQQLAEHNTETPNKATDNTEENQQNDSKDVEPTDQPEQTTSKEDEKADNETVVKGTILIYDNVTLYDIGKQAEDAGILENGRELELFLYKPEYSRSIQKGQFELSSDMTLEEMAVLLTGKNNR